MNTLVLPERSGHTVANLLVKQMLKDPTVTFAAYTIPNPSEDRTLLKYQSTKKTCVSDAAKVLYEHALMLRTSLEKNLKTRK